MNIFRIIALAAFLPLLAHGASFPYVTFNGKTNRLSDSGSALTYNGSAIGGATFANPTASVSGSAVNGSASTAMRSDAAPALAAVGTAGTYRSVTTDAQGRVTFGTDPTTFFIPIIAYGQAQQYWQTITHAGTITINMVTTNAQYMALTGNVTFASSGVITNGGFTLEVLGASTNCSYTFPSNWKFHGYQPASIAAGKFGRFTGDIPPGTNVMVFYSEQP